MADPKLLFRIRCRIRIRPLVSFGFGSGFGSGFESGFESWIRIRMRNRPKTKKHIEEVGTAVLLELGRHYEIRPHSRPQVFLQGFFAVLRHRIRDPVPF